MLEIIVELPDLYGDSQMWAIDIPTFPWSMALSWYNKYYHYVHMNRTAAMVATLNTNSEIPNRVCNNY